MADAAELASESLARSREQLWGSIEKLLMEQTPAAATIQGLGSLYAHFLRARGLPIPKVIAGEDHWTNLGVLTVTPLLERVRASASGPIVLMKGAEVAVRYPGSARMFSDVDILVPEARKVHRELLDAGFLEVGDPELFYRIHHLRPLVWPTLPFAIEVHSAPKWPDKLPPPPLERIFGEAVPSKLGTGGILAPAPAQHALLLAAHAWAHEPLLRLRDLVDTRALAAEADPGEVEAAARAWRLERLWRTTDEAAGAVLLQGRPSTATRLWARHLHQFRERSVFESHLEAWLSGYWALPLRAAFGQTAAAVADEIRPAPEEGRLDKVRRVVLAARHARSPVSRHNALLGEAAARGRTRNPPDDDLEDEERAAD